MSYIDGISSIPRLNSFAVPTPIQYIPKFYDLNIFGSAEKLRVVMG